VDGNLTITNIRFIKRCAVVESSTQYHQEIVPQ
jgi:hypothetical protein